MKEKPVLRFTKLRISRQSVLLRLLSVNKKGDEAWVATSSPIHPLAATEICRAFEQPVTIVPPVASLREVLEVPGETAWASATASDVHAATLRACVQHDISAAWGVLLMVTLSPDCSLVESLKAVLNASHRETPSAKKRALLVVFNERASGRVRVDVLAVGLRGWHV